MTTTTTKKPPSKKAPVKKAPAKPAAKARPAKKAAPAPKRQTNGTSTRPLTCEYFPTKKGLWTWRLKSGNQVNWAGPSRGFSQFSNAERSMRDLVKRLGGSMDNVIEKRLEATPEDL